MNTPSDGSQVVENFLPRMSRHAWRLTAAAAIVLLGCGLYFAFVLHHGVNVLFWDEWAFVGYFRQFEAGRSTLWALLTVRHSDHLVGVPLVLMLFQYMVTDMSSKGMQLAGATLQCSALILLVFAARRELLSVRFPLLALAAVTASILSLAQFRNILWGFQPPWFLISLLLVGCLALLQRSFVSSSSYTFAAAAVAAVAASFTSMHGLLVWVAGAAFILMQASGSLPQRMKQQRFVIWIVATVATTIVYSILFLFGSQSVSAHFDLTNLFSTPLFPIKFVLMHFGSIAGDVRASLALTSGILVIAFALLAVYRAHLFGWDGRTGLPLGLMALPVGFAFLVLLGRSSFGLTSAVDLRYTAYLPLLLVGVLFLLFRRREVDAPAWGAIRWAYAAYLAFVLPSALYTGLVGGKQWRLEQGLAAVAVQNYDSVPSVRLERLVFRDSRLVKREAAYLKANRLNVFSVSPEALPAEVVPYLDPPPAFLAMMAANPAEAMALRQLWDTFVVGNDLRGAFDVFSPEFPRRLVHWAYGATKNGDHYLNEYLKDHRAAYEAVWSRLEVR